MSMPPGSPRLPSPPPPAEIQIGPKSPMMRPNQGRPGPQLEQTVLDANSRRRIHPGTRAVDMATGPPLVPLQELDSAFQLQEHLAALHYHHTAHDTTPITRENARLMATPPQGIDKTLWLYELCRFLVSQCNSLIVGFLFDSPPCSAATCPEMRASEWQFLCAVHDTPKSCCAIDYCCHTLDWAANIVTNTKIFPSRFVVDSQDKNTAHKNLVNVFRRLHRIFAHAWFQHRGVFWSVENQSGLYVFFKTVCDAYALLPAENYKLPPEAEGLDINHPDDDQQLDSSSGGAGPGGKRHSSGQIITIAKPPGQRTDGEDDSNYPMVSRTNTRRHIKSSPSVGSAITSVPEADEDDGSNASDLASRLRDMRISHNPGSSFGEAEEVELSSIPVIVEHGPVAPREPPVRPSSVIPPPGISVPFAQQQHDLEMSFSPEPEEPQPAASATVVAGGAEKEQQQQKEVVESEEDQSSTSSSTSEATPELTQSDEEQFEEFMREQPQAPPAKPPAVLDPTAQQDDTSKGESAGKPGEEDSESQSTSTTVEDQTTAAAGPPDPESTQAESAATEEEGKSADKKDKGKGKEAENKGESSPTIGAEEEENK
ncbi:hypothetical protein QBC35DRAFT_371571 [Podospora australis]|uniref:Mob1 family protein n=1 Tax=Podospora australis TaxID=1536484 RepID=A0AAN6X442_9PEZI|nr:hypothetical protein QBC35DRAFT_371571 [Podospora australis]